MAAIVDVSTKAPFTCIWIIENYSQLHYEEIKSPLFVAHSVSQREWYLKIDENLNFCCSLLSKYAPRRERTLIHAEFSLLDADGSPLISKRSYNARLVVEMLTWSAFLDRWTEFVPNNTLAIRCRIWRIGQEISTADFCHARTRLKTYTGSFLWPIAEFSTLKRSTAEDFRSLALDERRVHCLKPFTQKGPSLALILYVKGNSEDSENVYVEFLINKGRGCVFCCELSVLNGNGEMIEYRKEQGVVRSSFRLLPFYPLITRNKIFERKKLFLPNDMLLLKCSFEVCSGFITSEIEHCTPNVSPVVKAEEGGLDFCGTKDPLQFEEFFMQEVNDNYLDSSVTEKSDWNSCNKSCPLKAACRHLHSESTMSDVSLRIGTKLYPVHKNILSSRSPVFMSIFSKDVKDNIIDISNIQDNTLCRLLQYIYTGTVEDLQFENALDLYKAAADYQLLDLTDKCTNFFIKNLSEINVCDIMSLANQYQDKKLESECTLSALSLGIYFKIKKKTH